MKNLKSKVINELGKVKNNLGLNNSINKGVWELINSEEYVNRIVFDVENYLEEGYDEGLKVEELINILKYGGIFYLWYVNNNRDLDIIEELNLDELLFEDNSKYKEEYVFNVYEYWENFKENVYCGLVGDMV
jgi:hypothetical protein